MAERIRTSELQFGSDSDILELEAKALAANVTLQFNGDVTGSTQTSFENGTTTAVSLDIAANAVGNNELADSAVTTSKIVDGAVSTQKIADLAVETSKINTGAVTREKLATSAVSNDKVQDGTLTLNKFASGEIETEVIEDSAKLVTGGAVATAIAEATGGGTVVNDVAWDDINHKITYTKGETTNDVVVVQDTYSASSTLPISGKGVAAAINAVAVSGSVSAVAGGKIFAVVNAVSNLIFNTHIVVQATFSNNGAREYIEFRPRLDTTSLGDACILGGNDRIKFGVITVGTDKKLALYCADNTSVTWRAYRVGPCTVSAVDMNVSATQIDTSAKMTISRRTDTLVEQVGNSSLPVYVNSNGRIVACTPADIKAGKDGDGNTITSTYETRTNVANKNNLKATLLTGADDLNNITADYAVYNWASTSKPSNIPNINQSGFLEVRKTHGNSSFYLQTAYPASASTDTNRYYYFRYGNTTAWSDWKTVYYEATSTYAADGTQAVNGTAVASALSNYYDKTNVDNKNYLQVKVLSANQDLNVDAVPDKLRGYAVFTTTWGGSAATSTKNIPSDFYNYSIFVEVWRTDDGRLIQKAAIPQNANYYMIRYQQASGWTPWKRVYYEATSTYAANGKQQVNGQAVKAALDSFKSENIRTASDTQSLPTDDEHAYTGKAISQYVSDAVSGNVGGWLGNKTVVQANAYTADELKPGDYITITDSGFITLGQIQVQAGDEIYWVKESSTWQKKDNSVYVKKSDLATAAAAGIVRTNSAAGGVSLNNQNQMFVNGWDNKADKTQITELQSSKQDVITGAVTPFLGSNGDGNKVIITTEGGKLAESDTISVSELNALNNISGNIQNQLDTMTAAIQGKQAAGDYKTAQVAVTGGATKTVLKQDTNGVVTMGEISLPWSYDSTNKRVTFYNFIKQ